MLSRRIIATLAVAAACALVPAAFADNGNRGGQNGGRHNGGGYYGGGHHDGGGYYGGGHHDGGHHDGDHDGHWSGGWVIGFPWGYGGYGPGYYGYGYGYGPGYYGYGYSYPGPYGYGPYERRVIIERERTREPEVPAGPPPAAVWYYCDSAGAYYPYVNSCPEPWRQVPAEPPASAPE